MALDSKFTADIACCSECHDRFISEWPVAYLKDVSFEDNAISLSDFYSSSKMWRFYEDESEFWDGVKNMLCPACYHPIGDVIWPYNLPYQPPDDFEDFAGQIAFIASRTPFLVLTHEYAQLVMEEIDKAARGISPLSVSGTFYRGRVHEGFSDFDFATLGPPPKEFCTEGRYNHAAHPVLYLSSDRTTCLAEVSQPHKSVAVGEFKIDSDLSILDLSLNDGVHSIDSDVLGSLIFSSIASSPKDGSDYPGHEYYFSRFVADCCLSAGIDAIAYPSTKPVSGYNLVIINDSKFRRDQVKVVRHSVEPPTAA